jgi:hypothetical protein
MEFKTTIEVGVPAPVLWLAVADVEHWPEWTPTMNDITWLTGPPASTPGTPAGTAVPRSTAPLVVGGQARVRQPRLPELVWEVTDVRPGESFTWRTRSSGVTAIATHEIAVLTPERSELTLGLTQTGPMAGIAGFLTGRKSRYNLQQEAEGLKRYAEVRAGQPGG